VALSKAFASMLSLMAGPDVIWFHVPNGERRNIQTAVRLKRMGVKPGVSDYIIFVPSEGRLDVHFVELKTGAGRLSDNQRLFKRAVDNAGSISGMAHYHVVRSLGEAEELLSSIL